MWLTMSPRSRVQRGVCVPLLSGCKCCSPAEEEEFLQRVWANGRSWGQMAEAEVTVHSAPLTPRHEAADLQNRRRVIPEHSFPEAIAVSPPLGAAGPESQQQLGGSEVSAGEAKGISSLVLAWTSWTEVLWRGGCQKKVLCAGSIWALLDSIPSAPVLWQVGPSPLRARKAPAFLNSSSSLPRRKISWCTETLCT